MTGPLTTNRDMSDAEEALRMAGDVSDRLIAEARQKAAEIAAEARTKADELVAAGRAKGEELVTAGRAKGEELVTAGRAKGEEFVAAARARGEELVQEARATADRVTREKHQEIMDSLSEGRKKLQTQVAELQSLERDYRTHLLEYMEGQLAVAKSGVFNRQSELPK
jgi:cell division septum initiation protein DivIVA